MGFLDFFKKKAAPVADTTVQPTEVNGDNASVPTNEAVSNDVMPQAPTEEPPAAPAAEDLIAPAPEAPTTDDSAPTE